MKKVVIIGGGFSGALVAKKLEDKDFRVILIDKKDHFEFTPGILRAIVEPTHIKKIQVLHKHYLKKIKIILGEVKEVSEKDVFVHTKRGEKRIGFDYLVIASGSSYNSPIKEKNLMVSSRTGVLRKSYEKLCHAKNILIIGGGIVGTELAAEIATYYQNKNIVIVHSGSELMERQNEKARKYAENFLREKGAKIVFNENAVRKEGRNYVTDKGTRIRADLAFLCTGIQPNFEFMKKHFHSLLNEKNHVKVNSFLQLENHKKGNIFAAGDITAIDEEKLAQNAEKQGKTVAKNIVKFEAGRALKEYRPNPKVMVISLGKFDGILAYKSMAVTGVIPGILKILIEWGTMLRYKSDF